MAEYFPYAMQDLGCTQKRLVQDVTAVGSQ
jgi:hypothetical protein